MHCVNDLSLSSHCAHEREVCMVWKPTGSIVQTVHSLPVLCTRMPNIWLRNQTTSESKPINIEPASVCVLAGKNTQMITLHHSMCTAPIHSECFRAARVSSHHTKSKSVMN